MRIPLDRALKLLWLAIGVMLLLFLLAGGVMILSGVIRNMGAGDEAVRVASQDRPMREEPRAVRYGAPEPVLGTDTRIALVDYGRGYGPGLSGDYGSSGGRGGVSVNVMFLDADGGVRLLLDRPAFITQVSYPGVPSDMQPPERPLARREWISYLVALDDTNGNGRLDERDALALYATDLDGRNLRRVAGPPLRYLSHEPLGPTRMLVYALQPPQGEEVPEDRMPQRAFVYDVPSGRLSPYTAMDSAAARAGRILGR